MDSAGSSGSTVTFTGLPPNRRRPYTFSVEARSINGERLTLSRTFRTGLSHIEEGCNITSSSSCYKNGSLCSYYLLYKYRLLVWELVLSRYYPLCKYWLSVAANSHFQSILCSKSTHQCHPFRIAHFFSQLDQKNLKYLICFSPKRLCAITYLCNCKDSSGIM